MPRTELAPDNTVGARRQACRCRCRNADDVQRQAQEKGPRLRASAIHIKRPGSVSKGNCAESSEKRREEVRREHRQCEPHHYHAARESRPMAAIGRCVTKKSEGVGESASGQEVDRCDAPSRKAFEFECFAEVCFLTFPSPSIPI
jgi:hypothetical protein